MINKIVAAILTVAYVQNRDSQTHDGVVGHYRRILSALGKRQS